MSIAAELVERARAVPIAQVIDQRGIKLRGRIECVGPCPVCGGTDRFSINTKKQLWNCRGCQRGGDGIALVQLLEGISFREACAVLAGDEKGCNATLKKVGHANLKGHVQTLQRVADIWNQTQPILKTPGAEYLFKRGIDLDEAPDVGGLRWHPQCPWGEYGSTTPCVVARFTDAITNEPRGIHRRPINGEKPKTLGPMAGCVIRLWPDDLVAEGLVIGEGIETTLAAATRIKHLNTFLQPAWACGSAGNLGNFPVLPGIESLTILVDHDDNGAGERDAEKCARRWHEAGREVIRLMPGAHGDFNDLVKP